MSATLQQPINKIGASSLLRVFEMPDAAHVDLYVTDAGSVRELTIRQSGRGRDEYTLWEGKTGQ